MATTREHDASVRPAGSLVRARRRIRGAYRRFARALGQAMPTGLYARSLLIIVMPVVLLQAQWTGTELPLRAMPLAIPGGAGARLALDEASGWGVAETGDRVDVVRPDAGARELLEEVVFLVREPGRPEEPDGVGAAGVDDSPIAK